jgi:hypothetical protein
VCSASKRKIPETRAQQLLSRLAAEPEGYAECYPGMEEMHDAVDDSDDEVDYTKMDLVRLPIECIFLCMCRQH